VEGGQRNLRGPHQEELVARDLVDHLPLSGEVPGAEERVLANEDRRDRRHIALAAQSLHREPHQGELDHHQVPQQVGEARARGLGGRLHLDPPVALGQIQVVEDLEVEVPRLAHLAERHVVLLRLPIGRLRIGEIR
jgi:hypothetical protein